MDVEEIIVDCFAVEVPEGWEPRLDDEHDDYRWCGPEEAVALLHWPETHELVRALAGLSDPSAPLKERAWSEVAGIDAALERGEIDEEGWHRAIADLLVPAYLAADTPWGGSGMTGGEREWEGSRRLVVDARKATAPSSTSAAPTDC